MRLMADFTPPMPDSMPCWIPCGIVKPASANNLDGDDDLMPSLNPLSKSPPRPLNQLTSPFHAAVMPFLRPLMMSLPAPSIQCNASLKKPPITPGNDRNHAHTLSAPLLAP